MEYRIGIDLGGTNTAIGIVDDKYHILYRDSIPTKAEKSGVEILEDVVQLIHRLLKNVGISLSDIKQIGVGVPGTANKTTGILEYANNLNFSKVSVTDWLEERLHCQVRFDNDANAAALGEYLVKDVSHIKSFLMVTLGTGVGGGVILDGKLLEGCNYAAAEFGHMVIEKGGRPCTCGRKGCFEAYGSVTALITMATEAVESHVDSLLYKKWKENQETLDGRMICDCVKARDDVAIKILNQYTDYLATGLTNLVNLFQPDVICIGGGISAAADLFLDSLQKQVREESYTSEAEIQTVIQKASLGNDAGIIGAAFLQ